MLEKVSLVVMNHSQVEFGCLKSVYAQDYENIEVKISNKATRYIHPADYDNKYLNIMEHRATIIDEFLASDSSRLLMVDNDVELPIDAVTKLVSKNLDVVAGWYMMTDKHCWVAARWINRGQTLRRLFSIEPGLVEVDLAGMGCVMVSKKAAVVGTGDYNRDPKFCITELGHRMYWGSSLMFCYAAQELGFKVYMDSDVVCGHIDRKSGETVR